MKIVGVGCGPGLLTEQARAVIREATLIVGSDRAISLVREEVSPYCEVREIEDYRALKSLPDEAIVLSTGDPMLSGLGYLPGDVIPGISSVQLGAARLHIPLTGLLILSAHGRDHEEAISMTVEEVSRGRKICLITDPGFQIDTLAKQLLQNPDISIIACQDIGYDYEDIIRGTPANPPKPTSGMYILFIFS
ncbi:MAG: cobalt-precorrin-7 (C(5))-methyltransferase [Methanobacteriota archaeon]